MNAILLIVALAVATGVLRILLPLFGIRVPGYTLG